MAEKHIADFTPSPPFWVGEGSVSTRHPLRSSLKNAHGCETSS